MSWISPLANTPICTAESPAPEGPSWDVSRENEGGVKSRSWNREYYHPDAERASIGESRWVVSCPHCKQRKVEWDGQAPERD